MKPTNTEVLKFIKSRIEHLRDLVKEGDLPTDILKTIVDQIHFLEEEVEKFIRKEDEQM